MTGKLRDEQYVWESGIGDLDLILGFNNQEGATVAMVMVAYNMSLETACTPDFFGNVLNFCLTHSGINKSEVVKKVS